MIDKVHSAGAEAPRTLPPMGGRVSEIELEQRFRRSGMAEPDEVVFEFTRDPVMLHQFDQLRRRMFLEVWSNTKTFSDPKRHEYDERGTILVARVGKLVVGGLRLIIKNPRSRFKLTVEEDGIDLPRLLPEYHLDYRTYAEVSSVARLPEYRGHAFMLNMHEAMKRKCLAHGADLVFCFSNGVNIRNYRMMYRHHVDRFRVLDHIPMPDKERYEGEKMALAVIELHRAPAAPMSEAPREVRVSEDA